MKNSLSNSLVILALTCAYVANAALYKGLDSEGRVVFSDRPFEDAKKFTLPPISVVGTSENKAEKNAAVEEKAVEFSYTSFDIVSPTNNQIFYNDVDVVVSLNIKPGLNTGKMHSIWMLVDGKPQIENTQDMSLQLGRVSRGTHALQAQIRSAEGEIIARTRITVVFIRPASTPKAN